MKQNLPMEGDTSMYEIFNRLNSGGVNLRPQENQDKHVPLGLL